MRSRFTSLPDPPRHVIQNPAKKGFDVGAHSTCFPPSVRKGRGGENKVSPRLSSNCKNLGARIAWLLDAIRGMLIAFCSGSFRTCWATHQKDQDDGRSLAKAAPGQPTVSESISPHGPTPYQFPIVRLPAFELSSNIGHQPHPALRMEVSRTAPFPLPSWHWSSLSHSDQGGHLIRGTPSRQDRRF